MISGIKKFTVNRPTFPIWVEPGDARRHASDFSQYYEFKNQLVAGLNVRQSICTQRIFRLNTLEVAMLSYDEEEAVDHLSIRETYFTDGLPRLELNPPD